MPSKRLIALAVIGALAALAAMTAPFASARPHAAACVPVKNVEAIIDDSGSMAGTDPNRLRAQAVQQLIESQALAKSNLTFGAVAFGSDASTLFAPAAINDSSRTGMESALNALQADDGSTNYGAAFTKAASDNPSRNAQIFLTDGGNNGDPIPPNQPRTYVIGFGDSGLDPANQQALQNLATSTGGQYFAQTDSSKLVSVMNQVQNLLTCQRPAQTFNDNFTKVGQVKTHGVNISRSIHSLRMVLSWATPGSQFILAHVIDRVKGQIVGKARVRKLKITRRSGETFQSVVIRGIRPGSKIKFQLKAQKLGAANPFGSSTPPGQLTTQVTPSRKK